MKRIQFCVQDDELNYRMYSYLIIGLGVAILLQRDVCASSCLCQVCRRSTTGPIRRACHTQLGIAGSLRFSMQLTSICCKGMKRCFLMSYGRLVYIMCIASNYMTCCISVSVLHPRQEDHISEGLSLPPFAAQKSRVLDDIS